MIEELFHIGSFSISPFGLMLMLAFLTSYWRLSRGMALLKIGDADDASSILLWAGLGGILGGKIYYAILYKDWHLIFDRSGIVWYGGFLLGSAAVLVYLKRNQLPFWPVLDAATPALALGYAVGRVGCFLVGDDYGVPTDLPWGVAFPVGLPPTTAGQLRANFNVDIPSSIPADELLKVHPTQLYETLIALVIAWIGWQLLKKNRPAGVTALSVFILLALERFGVEFFRAKDDRFLGLFTVAQLISVVLVIFFAALWVSRRNRPVEDNS